MDWIVVAVQWLHVVLGVFWFGAVLYSDFILIPALNTLPLPTQKSVGAALGARANRILPPVAVAVVLLGILRGTVFGPIKSLDALTTPYGITWLVALLVTIATLVFAIRVLGPALERLGTIPEAEALNPDGLRLGRGHNARCPNQASQLPRAGAVRVHLHVHDPDAVRPLSGAVSDLRTRADRSRPPSLRPRTCSWASGAD